MVQQSTYSLPLMDCSFSCFSMMSQFVPHLFLMDKHHHYVNSIAPKGQHCYSAKDNPFPSCNSRIYPSSILFGLLYTYRHNCCCLSDPCFSNSSSLSLSLTVPFLFLVPLISVDLVLDWIIFRFKDSKR
jgi:hypothetical protein